MCACAVTKRNASELPMARRGRIRAGSQDRERSIRSWAQGNPVELFEKLDGDVDAHIRLLRADDTTAELLRSLIKADNGTDPVALIEPLRNALVWDGEGGYDIRIAIATKMGLPLAGPIGAHLAAGWTLGPRQEKWELTDATGTVIARFEVVAGGAATEPAWTAQAIAAC